MKRNVIITLGIIALLLAGCNLFHSRTPEEPTTDNSSYVPPTTPDIVIDNFEEAIFEKNAENYTACFSDSSQSDIPQFSFIPSADAYAHYAAIFDSWNLSMEKRTFISMVSKLSSNIAPQLELKKTGGTSGTQDPVIYNFDYLLRLNHDDPNLPKVFSGTMQFILKHKSNGLWTIVKWTDFKVPNDTIPSTWSILKAQLIN